MAGSAIRRIDCDMEIKQPAMTLEQYAAIEEGDEGFLTELA